MKRIGLTLIVGTLCLVTSLAAETFLNGYGQKVSVKVNCIDENRAAIITRVNGVVQDTKRIYVDGCEIVTDENRIPEAGTMVQGQVVQGQMVQGGVQPVYAQPVQQPVVVQQDNGMGEGTAALLGAVGGAIVGGMVANAANSNNDVDTTRRTNYNGNRTVIVKQTDIKVQQPGNIKTSNVQTQTQKQTQVYKAGTVGTTETVKKDTRTIGQKIPQKPTQKVKMNQSQKDRLAELRAKNQAKLKAKQEAERKRKIEEQRKREQAKKRAAYNSKLKSKSTKKYVKKRK